MRGGHSRQKMKKDGSKTTITSILKEFEVGEKVIIKIDPSFHEGMPHPRYQGVMGIVKGKRGESYEVEIKDGKKKKLLVVNTVHLKKVEYSN